MNTKLTLRIDHQLIKAAKVYAARTHRPLSRIVADFFAAIHKKQYTNTQEITPAVASLRGVLKESSVDEEHYKQHLSDKYL